MLRSADLTISGLPPDSGVSPSLSSETALIGIARLSQ